MTSDMPALTDELSRLAERLRNGDRASLARAITLVESSAARHRDAAQALLNALIPHSGGSIRVGLTGAPGAGKSSLIDALGCHITAGGQRVAALTVDPSSALSGGSILGDKTRMGRLSREPKAFIRPSPSGGILGGVGGGTREAILLCEAAGYAIVLVETVGTGQSEAALRDMVDCLLLLTIAGAGDELQGIKRGLIESADLLIVNKADGDNIAAAQSARAQYASALRFIQAATPGWRTRALTASALTGAGVDELWRAVEDFTAQARASGGFQTRRKAQRKAWLRESLEGQMRDYLDGHEALQAALPQIEAAVVRGQLPARSGARQLLQLVLPD